jgi:hypothetical protein
VRVRLRLRARLRVRGRRVSAALAAVATSGALLAACSETSRPRPGSPAPAWLDHPPAVKSELCATGVSGPTYYSEDALARSKSAALTELGRAVQVKVTSGMTVKQREDSAGSSVSVQELSAFMSEAVLHFAQVRGQWVNPGGYPARGEAGTAYTLVCMPLNVSTAELQGTMGEGIRASNPRFPALIEQTEAVLRDWAQ